MARFCLEEAVFLDADSAVFSGVHLSFFADLPWVENPLKLPVRFSLRFLSFLVSLDFK